MSDKARFAAIGQDKKSVLRNRTYELFGFGCYYAWFLSVIVSGSFFELQLVSAHSSLLRLGFAVCLATGYILMFLFRKRPIIWQVTREKIIFAGFGGTIGTIMVVFANGYLAIIIAALLLAGIGNAYLMMAGGELWSSSKPNRAMLQLASSVVAATLVFLITLLVPAFVRICLVAIFPAVCALILATSERGSRRHTDLDPLRNLFGSKLEQRFILSIFFVSSAFGIALGFAASLSEFRTYFYAVVFIGSLLSSLFVLACALKTAENRFLFLVIRNAPLLLTIGCVTLPVYLGLGGTVFLAGFLLYDAFLWLLNSALIYRTQVAASNVLPRFEMAEWIGISFGFFIGLLLFMANGIASGNTALCSFICGSLIAIGLLGVFGQADAMRFIEARRRMDGQIDLEDRCYDIAESRNLTKREREILLYLAKGRSIPFICQDLCIAEGTVKSHVRHVYEKLGVSNKQELIDMVESSDPR